MVSGFRGRIPKRDTHIYTLSENSVLIMCLALRHLAIMPTLHMQLTSAFASNNSFTTSTWPSCDAQYSGVDFPYGMHTKHYYNNPYNYRRHREMNLLICSQLEMEISSLYSIK